MKLRDYVTVEEIRDHAKRSDWIAAGMFVGNWSIVFAAMLLVYVWTNPLTIIVSLCIIAGRQHGIGGLMHECGHNTLFASKRMNQIFGQWLAAKPVFEEFVAYADGHKRHHQKAGTKTDPDLPNYAAYPVSKNSFKRKLARDLTGQTGFRRLGQKAKETVVIFSSKPEKGRYSNHYFGMLLVQLGMIAFLHFTLSAWLYFLWIGANLTVYMFFIRMRQIAEHAAVPDLYNLDPRLNTRTTYANWFERMTIAPNFVNYHLEHHLSANVPCYRLKAFHHLLKSRGAYDTTPIFSGYIDVIQHVTDQSPQSNRSQSLVT